MDKKYILANVDELHEKNPETFEVPDLEERQALTVGAHVKLHFNHPEPKPEMGNLVGERMWVKITKVLECGHFVGELDNHPVVISGLSLGDEVRFGVEHVATC